jgi:hypothetical protein
VRLTDRQSRAVGQNVNFPISAFSGAPHLVHHLQANGLEYIVDKYDIKNL